MKQVWKTLLLFIALATVIPSFSQEATTQGKEFWLSFIGNGFKNHPQSGTWLRVQLLVSAKRTCEGTIANPNTGWTQNFSVQANNIFSIDLNETQVYVESSEYEQIVNKGLQITATDTVSVYCANIAAYSFDASYVLPTPSLSDDYIIQTYDQSSGPAYDPSSAFVIVATEDNTIIDITPSVKTLGGRPAHQEFSITLNKGQAYQVRSHMNTGTRDLSGTRVTARDCKKIAIFNGNNLTLIPASASSDSDCVFEQAMPLHSWGKKFVVTSSLNRNADYVKITSSADGNTVLKNGTFLCNLNANESFSFKLNSSDKSCYLEASHSCAVYLYNTSSNGSGNGAPSMVWIAPIEQRIDEITFSTFNYEHTNVNINKHYVNIIVESQDVGQVYLDNSLLSPDQFETVAGNDQYSFYRKQISHGVHRLSCPKGFNAHVYGFGDARGYAYMVGSKATDLSTTIFVNDIIVNSNDTVSNCTLDPVTFTADINLSNYNLLWEFGDGTTSTENPVVHTYGDHELYEATLTVTTEETPCDGSSTSNSSTFYINARRDPDVNYNDEICSGQLYSGYGFSNVHITNDTILTQEQPSPLNPDCMRLVNVAITCFPVSDTTINNLVCFKGPNTYTENGFNLYYDRPGNYTDSIIRPNSYGCDRYLLLNLEVGEIIDYEPQIESGHCNSFEWNGNLYTASGQYTDTIPDSTGCYTVHHLDLELDYAPNPTDIFPTDTTNHAPHWVITATEFQINSYEFCLKDDVEHTPLLWDTIIWHFENPSVQWILEPDITTLPVPRMKCRMYVLNYIEDTVWLAATVKNDCGSITKRYWFVSSFYGIDENNPSAPSTGSGAFEVTPNPNNGQMQLSFKNIVGTIDIKVFDMRGTLIDQLKVNCEAESYSLPYQCKTLTDGLYFFVATWQDTVLTKKVIISP